MHNAPAVSYPVGRSHLQGAFFLGVGVLGAVIGMVWHQQSRQLAVAHGLFLALWLLAAFVLLSEFRRTASGVLNWDGQQWSWLARDHEKSGKVRVRLDFQGCCLLQFRPDVGPAFWLWPQGSADPTSWPALRRALVTARDQGPVALSGGVRTEERP